MNTNANDTSGMPILNQILAITFMILVLLAYGVGEIYRVRDEWLLSIIAVIIGSVVAFMIIILTEYRRCMIKFHSFSFRIVSYKRLLIGVLLNLAGIIFLYAGIWLLGFVSAFIGMLIVDRAIAGGKRIWARDAKSEF